MLEDLCLEGTTVHCTTGEAEAFSRGKNFPGVLVLPSDPRAHIHGVILMSESPRSLHEPVFSRHWQRSLVPLLRLHLCSGKSVQEVGSSRTPTLVGVPVRVSCFDRQLLLCKLHNISSWGDASVLAGSLSGCFEKVQGSFTQQNQIIEGVSFTAPLLSRQHRGGLKSSNSHILYLLPHLAWVRHLVWHRRHVSFARRLGYSGKERP